jgi:hypothetical protein
MSTNLQGNYNFLQGILENNLQTLQIKSRRAQSDKPNFYLVGINPDESEAYISSLYPHHVDWSLNKHYQFDYGNDYYLLTIDEWHKVAEIKKIGVKKVRAQNRRVWGEHFGSKSRKGTRNSTNAINNVELGTKIVPV